MDPRISHRRTAVLVLTDEAGLIRLARSILEPACRVTGRAPSLDGDADIAAKQADVLIFDTVDLDVISAARGACPDAQVIALCREYREADCVAILNADADYLPRPFRAEDLAARVRVAELRRFNATGRRRVYRNGPLAFDLFDGALAIDGQPVALGPSEVAILSFLASQPGVVAEHKQLLAVLGFGGSVGYRRALRSCVLRLRRKIERDSNHPEVLLAEAGVGYRLAPTQEPTHRPRDCLPTEHERGDYS
jgi:two-component system, OmpR family, KDP operon response regulator KdpE